MDAAVDAVVAYLERLPSSMYIGPLGPVFGLPPLPKRSVFVRVMKRMAVIGHDFLVFEVGVHSGADPGRELSVRDCSGGYGVMFFALSDLDGVYREVDRLIAKHI